MPYCLETITIEEFKKLPCWNLNFHRFEDRNSISQAYQAGFEDAYCLLVEELENNPSANFFSSKEKAYPLYFGSEKEFLKLFDFDSRRENSFKGKRLDLAEAYWLSVEEVLKICQAICTYPHPVVTDQQIIKLKGSSENLIVSFKEEIIQVSNMKGEIIKEIPRKGRLSIYLEEILDLESALFGKYYLDS